MAARITVEESGRPPFRVSASAWSRLSQRIVSAIAPGAVKNSPVTLSLAWVRDHEIRRINGERRGLDEPTDVLSFSFLDRNRLPAGEICLGELIISLDTLKRQAAAHGHSQMTEARILFVHGLLHILGFDHEKPADLQKMLRQEKKYLGDKAGLIERMHSESKKVSQKRQKAS